MSYSRFIRRTFNEGGRNLKIVNALKTFKLKEHINFQIFKLNHFQIEVGSGGFEPPKSKDSAFTVRPIWPLWKLPNAAHTKSQRRDSNPRPADYKSAALPAELLWRLTMSKSIQHAPLYDFPDELLW